MATLQPFLKHSLVRFPLEPSAGIIRTNLIAMSLGPYASSILTSYLAATLVVGILITWIAVDHRLQKRRLRELEESGVVRRSGRSVTEVW
jgi:heme exporter protein CcmD